MFHKFTLVAPVWFQMAPGDKLNSEKVGFQNIRCFLIGASWLAEGFNLSEPVFFFENSNKKIDMKIQGEHDVDRSWISEVKSTGAKVVPRLIFEKWSPKILKQLLENEQIIMVSFWIWSWRSFKIEKCFLGREWPKRKI